MNKQVERLWIVIGTSKSGNKVSLRVRAIDYATARRKVADKMQVESLCLIDE